MKHGFKGELDLRHRDKPVDGKWFKTLQMLYYIAKDGTLYTIPKWINTDFASVPLGLRWLIPRVGKHDKAAVLHDWLCEFKIVDRKKADKLFLESMKTLKVNFIKRRAMYAGVRSYSMTIGKFKK